MRNKSKSNRRTSLLLIIALTLSSISPVWATENTDSTEVETGAAAELEAEYPYGVFGLSAVKIQTHEYSGQTTVEVVRQGGTRGSVSVTVKAIDATAVYGQDYRISVPGAVFDRVVPDEDPEAPDVALPETASSGYGLRSVREQATGKPSDREKYAAPEEAERAQLDAALAAAEDFYEQAPGTEFTLHFAEGEHTKSFELYILNDDLPEAQEQVVFVLTNVTGGGVMGQQKEATVTILDDEPYETPVLCFSEHSYTATDGSAVITLIRTEGINYYAGARIATVGDSARPGTDYTELGQKILFLPGQRELRLEIPVEENCGLTDTYFDVKLEPDRPIVVRGSETVRVRIPAQSDPVPSEEQSDSAVGAREVQSEGITLGIEKIVIEGKDLHCTDKSQDNWHFYHSAGWWETEIKYNGNWSNTVPKDESKKFYLSTLDSAYADVEYFHEGGNGKGWLDVAFDGRTIVTLGGKDTQRKTLQFWTWAEVEDSEQQKRMDSLKELTEPMTPWVHCYGEGAYFAGRIYSFTMNYRHFEFDIRGAATENGEPREYTFDYSDGSSSYETVVPGTIEIRDGEDNLVKGFYTSQESTEFTVTAKEVRDNWVLQGIRFVNPGNHSDFKYFDLTESDKIVIDAAWLRDADKYCTYNETDKIGAFLIQPVFARSKATVSVYLWPGDEGKGHVVNMQSDGHQYKTFKTDSEEIPLHVGDKVVIHGVGKNNYTVAGYKVSYNNRPYQNEPVGLNAGILTVTLAASTKATPFFGAQQLRIRRDPDNAGQFPDVLGAITYGGESTTSSGTLENIQSGQYVEFVSIPPVGYTTQWANRTGDTNENGVLEEFEIQDPLTKELYRKFDYDGDGELDAEYSLPMYGDLFGYKVNQPDPLFYYYFVPMKERTLYKGPVTGDVITKKYTIRTGYAQAKNRDGKMKEVYVPVAGATVKMGGSYDPKNPDAQMGYGTATDSLGGFQFETDNLIKNANYLLTVDYGGVSYMDHINPSFHKQVILPTFTSMKPISIEGTPEGGKDSNVVSESVVMLQDREVHFTLTTESLEPNVEVAKAIFRIYSSGGTFLSETEVDATGADKFVYTANLNEAFVPNARMTVQLVNQNGHRSMEYNTGFQFRPGIKPTLLPIFSTPGEKSVPMLDSVMGALDLGLAKRAENTVSDEGYTVYLGIGKELEKQSKELINTMDDAKKDDKKAKEKIKTANDSADQKEDTNVKVKSTLNNKLGVKVSMKLNIFYDDKAITKDSEEAAHDPNRDQLPESPYYFGDLMLIVTLEDTLSNETLIALPVGITVILKLDIGGSVTGYVCITPHAPVGEELKKVYADAYGHYPFAVEDPNDDDRNFDISGGVILEPSITLTVGVGYGVGVVSLSGNALFKIVFDTTDGDRGDVTLTADVKVTVMGFEVYKHNFGHVKTDLFGDTKAMMAAMLNDGSMDSEVFRPVSRDYWNNRTGWCETESLLQDPGPDVAGFTEQLLMGGIYPHPDPQLMRIDADSLLLVFVEDDPARTDANRGAIYYSVSHDNGASFGQPVLLSNDGTLDSHPRLEDLGDSILVLYSSLSGQVSDEMGMEDILERNELEMAFFEKGTCQVTPPAAVTQYTGRADAAGGGLLGDYYSDLNGNAVYDPDSGQVLILYEKTDYTSDEDEDFCASDLFDSYGTIAYRVYDTRTDTFLPCGEEDYPAGLTNEEKAQWDLDWYGQRFLDTEITDDSLPGGVLSDPLIFDLTAEGKGSTAYIAYTVDPDGDLDTVQDRDIYMQTYSFIDGTFTQPVKVSDREEGSAKADGRPLLVTYHGDMYVFFHAETAIHYYDVDDTSMTFPCRALSYEEEHLPVHDYQVAVGDDGKMYLVWTEPTIRLEEGVAPGSQASLLPENSYHENQIYAALFYEDFEQREDAAEDVRFHSGWSNKVQLTAGPGSYTDPGVSVMADGRLIVTAKKNEKIPAEEAWATHRVDDIDATELVVLQMTPVSVPEMKEDAIMFSTEYPLAEEPLTLYATAGNRGLIPVSNAAVDFYAVQGETETLIGTATCDRPIYGGQETVFAMPWTAPEHPEGIVIAARLRSGEGGAVPAETEEDFPFGVRLAYSLIDLEYIGQDLYRAYLEVHHTGNRPLGDAELVISRIDAEKQAHELKRVALDAETAALEMFVIDEGFEIPEPEDASSSIEVRIEEEGERVISQIVQVERILPAFHRQLLAQVNEVETATETLVLRRGERSGIPAEIDPAEAAETNSIVYASSNPSVAAVDETGGIRALRSGTAVVSAYAVPIVDVSRQTEDGYRLEDNLLNQLALRDCKHADVQVTVLSGSSGSGETSAPEEEDESSRPVTVPGRGGTLILDQSVLDSAFPGARSDEFSMDVTAAGETGHIRIYDISVKHGGEPLPRLENGRAQIRIPYTLQEGEDPNAIVVYTFTETGDGKIDTGGSYQDGMITFSTAEFSRIGVGYHPVRFNDVDPESWYADAVTYIAARNIAEGIGESRFAPEEAMSREAFAKFLAVTYGFSWSGRDPGFADVAPGSWYEPYVNALYEAGIIHGTGDGAFGTGRSITRQDMITMLFNALRKSGETLPAVRTYEGFGDEQQVADYASPAVRALYEAGIINGMGNDLLVPGATATRAAMAVILLNALRSAR
ncbi:MAG TPA: S-layer homology domain-containing protein [Bacillota bacterium]|nr:S-layer homology domain-containing protein [Bacillota bacterium]